MTAQEVLTEDQERALAEIIAAMKPGAFHALSGPAGTGKTTLIKRIARHAKKLKKEIVLTAPTHKAVGVLRAKIKEDGIKGVECMTIHSLLQLKAVPHGDQQVFKRDRHAKPVKADVVVIDECSMVGEDLLEHIELHLPVSFVLYAGDQAQIPPVGEDDSKTFATPSRSYLTQIVRQAQGNPVLDAAHVIRTSQGGAPDWSWCKQAGTKPQGVYLPGENADVWMRKAFTSPEFEADSDSFRIIAWTNACVADMNARVRQWRYGDNIPTPFMPEERALVRSPVMQNKEVLLNTNDEVRVNSIQRAVFRHTIEERGPAAAWVAEVPSWRMEVEREDGSTIKVHMPADGRVYEGVLNKLKTEARGNGGRWGDFHRFKEKMANFQPIYAQTCHTSQGSTHGVTFVNVADIRRCGQKNVLEMQRILYTAVTRPRNAVVLLGV